MRVDDPAFVRRQYETEANLAARKRVYANSEGPSALDATFDAVAEVRPERVLEVGGGEGELADRIVGDLGAELVAVDQSERMVEIQRAKGLDARVADVQELPFGDEEFDVVLAAWIGYAESWDDLAPALAALLLDQPLRVRRHSTVFVAGKD